MEEFKVISPSHLLIPYIKNYWFLKTNCDSPLRARIIPTGMMSLVFHRGNQLLSVHDNEFHPQTFLSGQEKSFDDLEYTGRINMISVVFHPVGVRLFFNLPINKLNNLRVTPKELQDKELEELEKSLTDTENNQLCISLIERFLLKRLSRFAEYNLKRIESSIHLINCGNTDVSLLANMACLSKKQFQRIFSEYVGANPKEFSRTIRFQKALHILEIHPEISFTRLAYQCGYFDQSHMIKEFKSLSGYSPREFLTICTPHSDYFS